MVGSELPGRIADPPERHRWRRPRPAWSDLSEKRSGSVASTTPSVVRSELLGWIWIRRRRRKRPVVGLLHEFHPRPTPVRQLAPSRRLRRTGAEARVRYRPTRRCACPSVLRSPHIFRSRVVRIGGGRTSRAPAVTQQKGLLGRSSPVKRGARRREL